MTLAKFLETSCMKHSELAIKLGVSQAAVTRYVKGLRMPRPDMIAKIDKATGGKVKASDLLAGFGAPVSEAREVA